MKYSICPLCVIISGVWLLMSALVAWRVVSIAIFQLPIALLMGGTVVGIAFKNQNYKKLIIAVGMPIAYLLITYLTKTVVAVEFVVMIAVAYLLFIKNGSADTKRIGDLEKKMEQCC